MTEREKFEAWVNTKLPRSLVKEFHWEVWQACAEQYEATINTLNDAITEDKILAGINADSEEKLKVAENSLEAILKVTHYLSPASLIASSTLKQIRGE
jgi:hypothetical protein